MSNKEKKLETKTVRFSEEDTYHQIMMDMNFFEISKETEEHIFGWYKGTYIIIKK